MRTGSPKAFQKIRVVEGQGKRKSKKEEGEKEDSGFHDTAADLEY